MTKHTALKKSLILALLYTTVLTAANSAEPAKNFNTYKSTISEQLDLLWPELTAREFIPAQIQKETCGGATKSDKCFNPKTELKSYDPKTKKLVENGVGFGQTTIVWDANGKIKFDMFDETSRMDKSLRGWSYATRYDPLMQIRSNIVLNRVNYNKISGATELDRLMFTDSAYNAGRGRVYKDKQKCRMVAGCNPEKWVGNVEVNSTLTKKTNGRYNVSAYSINRGHVSDVFKKYMPVYAPYMVKVDADVK